MVILLKILQVVLALSLLVLVHEFGHFIFARLFKIRVEKFYLFFDPYFSLFKYKPKNSDTEYGIGWLPLGGYCKISGMIDESMDKEALKSEPQDWEFRAKPAWQRFFVLFGGVFFNLILAILIYIGIMFTWGESYIKNSDVKTGVCVSQLAKEIGFKNGDRILGFDGNITDNFAHLQYDLIRNQAESATVIRGTDTITIKIDTEFIPRALNTPNMFQYGLPAAIAQIPDSSININSGLKVGDHIVTVNGEGDNMLFEITETIRTSSADTLEALIKRGEEYLTIPLATKSVNTPQGDIRMIEVVFDNNISNFYNITTKKYNLISAIPAGINTATTTLVNYFNELKLIFSPKTEAYKSVGSFITIAKIFPDSWDWHRFWNIVAFLSIMLAVLNILPIPALDGGHIVFTLYEMVTRRKPSDKFLEYAQMVGMILLFGLMILAFGNDIIRLFN